MEVTQTVLKRTENKVSIGLVARKRRGGGGGRRRHKTKWKREVKGVMKQKDPTAEDAVNDR
jgi:predicted RNase H-like nuclease (RuvC/YqgF family)